MKLESYRIHARVADMGTVDSEAAGLSGTDSAVPKRSLLSGAIASAISLHLSSRFIFPLLSCAVPGLVFASPEGGQVVAGTATISSPDANTTLITQSTSRTAIDWQRFNIGSQEYVQFVQPDANSVALNRVIGGDPSQILGNLSANGQVFLVNPNGVYFGQSATVDVGGIVASVNGIRNEDFMSDNYVFSKSADGPDDAGVVNDGVITARDGGYVVLMGDYVHNNGIISARLGTVALAAGNQITMDVKGNGLVSVAVDEETLSEVAGVNNTGDIIAAGGRVMMNAKVANDLIDTAINNEGLVVANSIAERDGVIFLTAAGGDIVNSGTLDASAEDGSNVDGGGVLVYSDKDIINEAGARINATGDGSGDGGVVRVIAEDRLDHRSGALIDVTSDEGKGGFVEVSGHGSLAIRGDTDIGTGGELLIDPDVLLIRNTGGVSLPSFSTGTTFIGLVDKGYIESQLNSNVNVTLVANNDINAGAGTLGGATFSLNATGQGDLSIINGLVTSAVSGTLGFCSLTGVCLPGGSNGVLPSTTGNINLGSVSFNIAGGLSVAGGTSAGTVALGGINAGGDVSISAGGSVTLNSNSITAGGDVTLAGGIGSTASLRTADLTISAGSDVNIQSDIFLANNNLVLAADTDVNGVGDVNITGNDSTSTTVSTQGNLNVSGNNFNVSGASASSFTPLGDYQVDVRANNIDVAITGDMVVSGGDYPPTSGVGTGTASVAVVVSATNNITINANSLTVQGGNAVSNRPSFASVGAINTNVDASAILQAEGGNLTANLTGTLKVSGGTAFADANVGGTATAVMTAKADASMKAGGDLVVTAATVDLQAGTTNPDQSTGGLVSQASAKAELVAGSAMSVMASNNITGIAADISAAGMYMAAGNNIDLLTSNVSVGNGTVAGIAGDALTLAFLQANGIPPPTTASPNAKFSAAGSLALGTITMDGNIPYLWLEADSTSITGLNLPNASDVVVQYSPFTPTASIGVEDLPDASKDVNYNNLEHFSILEGTTIIIGSSKHTGEINIGNLGKLDIGAHNMVFVTASNITTIDNIISTGIVAELLVGQFDLEEEFVTPVLTEVEVGLLPVDDPTDEKEKKKKLIKDDEEEIKMCEAG